MTDREFLLEISKRLVHKYAEHPSILTRLEEILKKIDNHDNKTKSNYKIIQDSIVRCIYELQNLHNRLESIDKTEVTAQKSPNVLIF